MNRNIIPFQALGMAQDMSPSARPLKPSLAFENLNLRISTNDGNTLYSMVNERGTKSLSLISGTGWEEGDSRHLETEILGTPIGTAVINETLVVFTHNNISGEKREAAIARRGEILEKLIPQAQSDISKKNAQLAKDGEDLSEVNADIPYYESELAQYQEELTGYTAKKAMFTNWCSGLREIKNACTATIDFSDEATVTSLENDIEALEQDITDYYYEKYGDDGSDEEETEWPQEMAVCKAALNSIWNDLENTRQPKDDSDIDLNALEDAAIYIEGNEIPPLNTLINRVNNNIATVEDNLQDLRAEKSRLENEIATLNREIEKLNENITNWRNELNALDTDINVDTIYLLKYSNNAKSSLKCVIYYTGYLGFNKDYPLETLVSYEAENIQKVYWTDGINQPRVINICKFSDSYNEYSFNFVTDLQLQEDVSVRRRTDVLGTFAPGVIQYAFTYYYKYGQESNIFHVTPLLYVSPKNRGGSPEERVNIGFQITVNNIDNNFEYLRIYSIQRTSLNAVPICKRVVDLQIGNSSSITYVDRGLEGDAVDPTELLYKGVSSITAYTMEQKDGTLFLGNIKLNTPIIQGRVQAQVKTSTSVAVSYRRLYIKENMGEFYANQLECYPVTNFEDRNTGANSHTYYIDYDVNSNVPCSYFRRFNTYRLGVQFQHRTGKWSDPVFIQDYTIPYSSVPELFIDYAHINGERNVTANSYMLTLPQIEGILSSDASKTLYNLGYGKLRPVVVLPENQDKRVICQGVITPCIGNYQRWDEGIAHYPSWFFRPWNYNNNQQIIDGLPSFIAANLSDCDKIENNTRYCFSEIQGTFNYSDGDKGDILRVTTDYNTFHSPDVEFNEELTESDYSGSTCYISGRVTFGTTYCALDVQTSTPPISSTATGAERITERKDNHGAGIISGFWYNDTVVDDYDGGYGQAWSPNADWRVYPWQKSGSFNNDVTRSRGVRSAVLKTKIISNCRLTKTYFVNGVQPTIRPIHTELWTGEDYYSIKMGDRMYVGHVDELLKPSSITRWDSNEDFKSREAQGFPSDIFEDWGESGYSHKENVRMKYKSPAHLIVEDGQGGNYFYNDMVADVQSSSQMGAKLYSLPIVDYLNTLDPNTIYGGNTEYALKQNSWIPCGDSVKLQNDSNTHNTVFNWSYGDTYYQRFDCLKTYPYTTEDENQIVEIGCFMLETYVNIDGRYDRNREQIDNTNMSPTNFNLLNPVYSQKDNFFSYRITSDEDTQEAFPNQITWSKTKQSGGDVDTWTNITLASILEMDGDKGKVTALRRKNNNLICFQDSGISQILYNENVQVASTEGVPIEIANSEKVLGKRYYTNTIGCSNKWSLLANDSGIYFMDSLNKALFMMTDTVTNLGVKGNMSVWIRNNMPAWSNADNSWTPTDHNDFVTYWDKQNQDILFINKDIALAWSEKLGAFTSFYSYGDTPYFCNLEDTGIWLRKKSETIPPEEEGEEPTIQESVTLWQHNTGEYCSFFGEQEPYETILVASIPTDPTSKIFTNLEINASIPLEGVEEENSLYRPYLPFDYLEAWTDYQHGIASLSDKEGTPSAMKHHLLDQTAHLDRKFRTWRCDIPRDNAELNTDSSIGIKRFRKHPLDRMRNSWMYFKLKKSENTNLKAEIHNIDTIYYQ